MARGDYYRVSYAAGGGVALQEVITARKIGGHVLLDTSGRDFIFVREENKARDEVRVAAFAKGAVLAIVSGHEDLGAKKARKS